MDNPEKKGTRHYTLAGQVLAAKQTSSGGAEQKQRYTSLAAMATEIFVYAAFGLVVTLHIWGLAS